MFVHLLSVNYDNSTQRYVYARFSTWLTLPLTQHISQAAAQSTTIIQHFHIYTQSIKWPEWAKVLKITES